MSRCPSKLASGGGAVLQCQDARGHVGNHVTTTEQWGDGHEDLIQDGDACCAGEPGYASPVDMHTEDCPEYLANMERLEAYQREQREQAVVVAAPAGVRVTLALTRRQANAILAAELSAGHGVRRSRDLVAAERRLMDAVQAGIATADGTR